MDDNAKKLIEGVCPYFKILKTINLRLQELIEKNKDNQPYDNEELFYYITSDLIRVLPVKGSAWENGKKYCLPSLDRESGIMLLRKNIDFLESEYDKFIKNEKCRQALGYILTIRNKYVHQPHNLSFCFSVGGNTSCSMGIYFKDKLQSISTIWLTNIVRDLNLVFEKIRQKCLSCAENCDPKYKEYPCYKIIYETSFEDYNRKYDIMPWNYIEIKTKENGDGSMGKVLDRAISFATVAHANQFRKSTSIPYILHPLEAATIVGTMTTDEEIIAGAVLHDVVEDTDTTIEEIKDIFGERVAQLVASESENKRENLAATSTWKIRKQETLDHLKAASLDVKMITLGDKLSNIRAIHRDYNAIGDELWQRFNQKDKDEHYWYYQSIADCISDLKDYPAYQEYCELVQMTFVTE